MTVKVHFRVHCKLHNTPVVFDTEGDICDGSGDGTLTLKMGTARCTETEQSSCRDGWVLVTDAVGRMI